MNQATRSQGGLNFNLAGICYSPWLSGSRCWWQFYVIMVKLMVRAKVKETGEFVEHRINVADEIRTADNDALYGFVSDFLDLKYGNIFKWFRFWTIP